MSKKESSPGNEEQAPDLSALDFGPSWARQDQSKKPRRSSQGKSSHGGGSGGKGRGHSHSHSHSGRKPFQGRDNRRNDRKKGHHRKDFKRGDRRKPVTPPAEGVKARIMPIEEGMDAMAKQITATGRTHSVFELAWVVLGGLERFHLVFESEEQPLYRSKSDHSVWLYQKECLAHFWSSGVVKKYYDEEVTEVDAPTGNFQSVARCGFSGKLIGPPNHHAYQQTLLDLYRERFSNMDLDRYKSKVVMEHGEEVVQEWIDSMRKHKRWRPKSEQAEAVEETEPEESTPSAEKTEPDSSEAQNAEAVGASVVDIEAGETGEGGADPEVVANVEANEPNVEGAVEEATSTEPPVPVIEETVVILNNRREVEQHFLSHGFELEFEKGPIMSALANIPAKMISPGLMALLRNTVAEEKRYPGNLASILCRQMSGRHLAVFKWKKRLHCGPARPKHVPDDMVMADRPAKLFQWVIAHPGGSIDVMWKDCLPADIDEDDRHLWYHDLHWLINEGLVLLFSDGNLHAAKELEKKKPDAKASKQAKKKTAKKAEAITSKEEAASEPKSVDSSDDAGTAVVESEPESERSEPESKKGTDTVAPESESPKEP